MIAYFKSRDVSVEVPDDMSEADLADVNQNFDTYFTPEPTTNPAGGAASPGSDTAPAETSGKQPAAGGGDTLREWKPNFYQAHVEPILQELGVVDIPLVQNREPAAYAFAGRAAEQLSFGALKPLTEDLYGKAYEQHPIWSFAGDLAGGVGSLMATGGALKIAGLEAEATRAAAAGAKVAAAAPRFVAPAIMAAGTFGTHTFITKTVEALQKGGVDVADFGMSVLKDTALGAALGSISGLQSVPVAVSSAAGLGYLSSKMEGGDHAENLLNAAIWGVFEAVGSFGREDRLRREALSTLADSVGEYVHARSGMDPEAARGVGTAFVTREAEKVGGIEAIIKSTKAKTLEFIEGLNQKIRNAKIETTPEPGAPRAAELGGGEVSTGKPAETPNFKNTNEALKWGAAVPDAEKQSANRALDARIAARQAALDEARAKGDFQAGMDIATQNQFDREAKETILGQTNPDVLKMMGIKTPADAAQPEGGASAGFAKSAKGFASSRPGERMHNYTEADQKAALINSLGGMDKIQKMQSPELVKLARTLTGDVPIVKKLFSNLGFFKPQGAGSITMNANFFKDSKLVEAVLAHEIGHLMDYKPDQTMKRGNILGRIGSLKGYRKSLLPESPTSTDTILTEKDRQRFRSQAEKITRAKNGEAPAKPKTDFDPQTILNVWNSVSADVDPALAEYVARLSTDEKKAIIRAAMEARKNGETLSLPEVAKFNKEAAADPASVAQIYRDLIKEEIKKRRLWEEEVIREELEKLTQYWEPFTPIKGHPFTTYRFSGVELYADFVSVLLNAPAKAKEIAPHAYEAFFNYLDQKPEVLKSLIEIQSYIQGDDLDLQRVRGEDILEMYERGEEAFRSRQLALEESKKSVWDKLRLIFWDKNSMLLDERNKLKKRQAIAPAQDAQYAIEKNSMMAPFVRSYLSDYDRNVYFAAREAGLLDEVKTVLFLDRVGADRSELANPLGHTPETAQAFLDSMKKADPVKFQKVTALAQAARDWFKNVSQIPGADDFWTPQQRAMIQNNDRYAPFRVVEYMRDYVAAGFSSQMGTFKDIGDPLTSLAMKGTSVAVAVERNRLKKITGEMLLRSGLSMTPAKISNEPGHFKITEPTENYLGTLAWKDGGKWVAYHLDKTIADTFNGAATEKIGMIGATMNWVLANPFFRATFITFNPGFQAVNLMRDFSRTWKTVPGLTLGKAFRLYAESIPEAKRRARGIYDPTIQAMERAGALQITLNDIVMGQTPEDTEIETFLNKYGVTPMVKNQKTGAWEPAKDYQGIPVFDQIRQLLDTLRFVGDAIETLPKVAGWKTLDQMDVEERAYFVRNLVGTPNPKRAGTAAPVTNAFLMFSNIFKEGFRGLIEAGFTNEKTRRAYWKKTAAYNFSLRLAMGLAAAGFFGAGVKAVMDKASEYHKSNYIVIPAGIDSEGNGIYVTIPQDEDARLMGAIMWKALNYEGNLMSNLSDVLSFGAGNFPSVSPSIDIAGAWLAFLSGKNPRDVFRDQDILTQQEKEAGGLRAFEPMARWTANETGLVRLDIRDKFSEEPIYKSVVTTMPVVNRFVRVGRQGEREKARAAGEDVRKKRAQEALDMKDQAAKALKEGKTLVDFLKGSKTDEEIDRRTSIYNAVDKKMTSDPIVQALNSAASNEEKVAILQKAGEGKEKKAYNAYLDELYTNRVISASVVLKVRNQA